MTDIGDTLRIRSWQDQQFHDGKDKILDTFGFIS